MTAQGSLTRCPECTSIIQTVVNPKLEGGGVTTKSQRVPFEWWNDDRLIIPIAQATGDLQFARAVIRDAAREMGFI